MCLCLISCKVNTPLNNYVVQILITIANSALYPKPDVGYTIYVPTIHTYTLRTYTYNRLSLFCSWAVAVAACHAMPGASLISRTHCKHSHSQFPKPLIPTNYPCSSGPVIQIQSSPPASLPSPSPSPIVKDEARTTMDRIRVRSGWHFVCAALFVECVCFGSEIYASQPRAGLGRIVEYQ